IAAAVLVGAAALAYPFWVVVAGPRHITGPVWPHVGQIAGSLAATVEPHAELAGVAFVSGGDGSYVGVPLLCVLAAGAIVLWRSTALRVSLGLVAVSYVASLGYDLHAGTHRLHVALPAAVLGHLPLFDSIVPERFGAMVDLFAGLALAVVLDHVRRWERPHRRVAGLSGDAAPAPEPAAVRADRARGAQESALTLLLALAVAALALVPLGVEPRWPYATTTVHRLPVLETPAPARQSTPPVVAVYPSSPDATAREMVAQARGGFDFSLPNGYAIVPGPADRAVESPADDALWLVFAAGSLHRLTLPLSATTRHAVRSDLRTMGVRRVLVLPRSADAGTVRRALDSVLGRPAHTRGGAALWVVRR
ncbi:MAG: hypothetical protein ACRDWE_09180, partial [Acidimicrobiales bacterium]